LLPLHELEVHWQTCEVVLQVGVVPLQAVVLPVEHCTHDCEPESQTAVAPPQQVVPLPHTALAPPAQVRQAPPEQYCPLEQQLDPQLAPAQ
jgi:hypothetical protein